MKTRKKTFAVVILIVVLAICLVVRNSMSWKWSEFYAAPDASALRVVVIPAKLQVHVGEKFDLQLRVENVSELKIKQTIAVWTCSWDDAWGLTDKRMMWEPWGCDGNIPEEIQLYPGDVYAKTLSVFVKEAGSHEKISFRASFASFKGILSDGKTGKMEYYKPIWSEPVTIEVVP